MSIKPATSAPCSADQDRLEQVFSELLEMAFAVVYDRDNPGALDPDALRKIDDPKYALLSRVHQLLEQRDDKALVGALEESRIYSKDAYDVMNQYLRTAATWPSVQYRGKRRDAQLMSIPVLIPRDSAAMKRGCLDHARALRTLARIIEEVYETEGSTVVVAKNLYRQAELMPHDPSELYRLPQAILDQTAGAETRTSQLLQTRRRASEEEKEGACVPRFILAVVINPPRPKDMTDSDWASWFDCHVLGRMHDSSELGEALNAALDCEPGRMHAGDYSSFYRAFFACELLSKKVELKDIIARVNPMETTAVVATHLNSRKFIELQVSLVSAWTKERLFETSVRIGDEEQEEYAKRFFSNLLEAHGIADADAAAANHEVPANATRH